MVSTNIVFHRNKLFFFGDEAIMSDFIYLFISDEAHDGFLNQQNKIS